MTGKDSKALDRMQREEQRRRAEAVARNSAPPDPDAPERIHGAPEPTMKERINDRSK